jgi:hypothetical protein
MNVSVEVAKAGKLPPGKTEIPFELPLKTKAGMQLYETYHGVFVNIQVGQATLDTTTHGAAIVRRCLPGATASAPTSYGRLPPTISQYTIRVDMKRSTFSKDLTKTIEFLVNFKGKPEPPRPVC